MPSAIAKNETHRWYTRRHRLNAEGYDSCGCYWGIGAPLYWCYRADGAHDFYIRGSKAYATAAAAWAAHHSDPKAACRYLNSNGRIGTERNQP